METVQSNRVEVAYRRAGSGPPIVLAHGAAEDGRIWSPQLEALADEFTVIAWDEPGAGASSDLPAGFALSDYADCLAAVIEHAGLGPAHVGGLSWGGTVALEMHRRHPDAAATLLLIDTYAGWKGSLPAEEVRSRVEDARARVAAASAEFDPTLPGLFAGEPPAEFVPLLEEMASAVRPRSLGAQLELMGEADLTEHLGSIEVPALLLWGECDVRSPPAVAQAFKRAIPNAELVLIPGAGHVSNLDRPLEFNRAVREFCRRHPPPGDR